MTVQIVNIHNTQNKIFSFLVLQNICENFWVFIPQDIQDKR